MKIKFLKDRFGYKANQIVDNVEDSEAKDFVAKGFAEEVVESEEAVAKMVAEELNDKIDAKVEAKVKAAVAEIAKSVKSAPRIEVGTDHEAAKVENTGGYKSFGEYAVDVRKKALGEVTDRMSKYMNFCKAQKANETLNSDVFVPTAYQTQLRDWAPSYDSFFPLTQQVPMQTQYAKVPFINTYAYRNTGATTGPVLNWVGNGASVSNSKFLTSQVELKLKTPSVLIEIAEELPEEVAGLEAGLMNSGSKTILKGIDYAIINGAGDGSGEPTGIMSATALIEIPQAAADPTYVDFCNMNAQHVGDPATSAWLIPITEYGNVCNLAVNGVNVVKDVPGEMGKPIQTILGIRIIKTPFVSRVMLVDFNAYLTGFRGAQRNDMTLALGFETHTKHYRFSWRFDGKPGPQDAYSANGVAVSPFVQLYPGT